MEQEGQNAQKSEIPQALCVDQCAGNKINILFTTKTGSSRGSLHQKHFVIYETCLLINS